jgi:hypothetical protein
MILLALRGFDPDRAVYDKHMGQSMKTWWIEIVSVIWCVGTRGDRAVMARQAGLGFSIHVQ